MHAILDADSILFRAALAAQEDTVWETTDDKQFEEEEDMYEYLSTRPELGVRGVRVSFEPLQDTIDSAKRSFATAFEAVGATHRTAYIGGPNGTFRDQVATIAKYKGNRDRSRDQTQLLGLRSAAIEQGWATQARVHLEADDEVIMAFHAAKLKYGVDDVILIGIDKDALQCPGWHYNMDTHKATWVSAHQALVNFYTQLLTGDAVDNIKGLYNVGKKSAHVKNLYKLETEEEMFRLCYEQYKCRFNNYTSMFMKETFVLLHMLRTYDLHEGEDLFDELWKEVVYGSSRSR